MQSARRWIGLLLSLALLSCGEKPQTARNNENNSAAANLSCDIPDLAEQFDNDSTKTRLVLLLSPT
jgi:hypothetical protein